jgi:hypothetical protein
MQLFMERLGQGFELESPKTRTFIHYLDEERSIQREVQGLSRRIATPLIANPIPEDQYYGSKPCYLHLYFGTGYRTLQGQKEILTVLDALEQEDLHAFFGIYTAGSREDVRMYSPSLLAISTDLETVSMIGPKKGPARPLKEFGQLQKMVEIEEGNDLEQVVVRISEWFLGLKSQVIT